MTEKTFDEDYKDEFDRLLRLGRSGHRPEAGGEFRYWSNGWGVVGQLHSELNLTSAKTGADLPGMRKHNHDTDGPAWTFEAMIAEHQAKYGVEPRGNYRSQIVLPSV